MRKVAMMAIALTFLTACEPNEMYPVPLGAGAGSGGNAGSYPANPPASRTLAPLQSESSPAQETHGVVNQQNCYDMEARFQRQGRRVRLVETRRSANSGAILRWICIFEGEDADQGYFEEKRY